MELNATVGSSDRMMQLASRRLHAALDVFELNAKLAVKSFTRDVSLHPKGSDEDNKFDSQLTAIRLELMYAQLEYDSLDRELKEYMGT